jgi:hypothetical protein
MRRRPSVTAMIRGRIIADLPRYVPKGVKNQRPEVGGGNIS